MKTTSTTLHYNYNYNTTILTDDDGEKKLLTMLEQDEGDDRDRTDVSHQYLGSQDEECHEPARVVCLFIVQLS